MPNWMKPIFALPLFIVATTARGQETVDVVQRPFAALNQLRSEVLATEAKLKSQKAKLDNDFKKIKRDQAAVAKLEKARDQARSEAKAANFKVSPENKKWLCNAFMVQHDDPSQCSEPGKGGVWVSVDENGKTSRYLPPTQAELDRAKAADQKLAKAQLDLDIQNAKNRQAEDAYKLADKKLKTESDELAKTKAPLDEPAKYVKDLKGIYVSAALTDGKIPDPELLKSFDKMADMVGKSEGSGECVALVQGFAGVGVTKNWVKGDSVKDSPFVPLSAAATFIGEKNDYPSYPTGNHAVIVLDKTDKGLLVMDQFNKRKDGIIEHIPARVTEIIAKGGIAAKVNQDKIEAGEKEAERLGLTKEKDGLAYFKVKYNDYNPGHDADNYSYIKKPDAKKK